MTVDKNGVLSTFRDNLPAWIEEATDHVRAVGIALYANAPRAQVQGLITAAFTPFTEDLAAGTTTHTTDYWTRTAAPRAVQGVSLSDMMAGISAAFTVVSKHMERLYQDAPEVMSWWWQHLYEITTASNQTLVEVFLTAREQIIRSQMTEIAVLSTPIVPMYEGILVVPIIGHLDDRRANQTTEALLEAIGNHQADQVILDITGVPVVDTTVAHALVMMTRAARLLGSAVILVGISSGIAQTLVQLGVDLSELATRANLQAGIETALAQHGLGIGALATS